MRRLLFALTSAAALWAAACSGGGSGVQPPPPTGKYSAASLNGTYVFITNGEVCAGCTTAAIPMARVGAFVADGAGHITDGVEDVNVDGGVTNAIPINSGSSYTVNADGRGTLTLNFGQSTLNFGITLTSTGDGLMIDETSTAAQASTGSGNFIKQTGGPFTVGSVANAYVFDFTGLDGNQTFPCPCPESFIGEFTANNGVINSGSFDDNDGFSLSSGSFVGTIAQDSLHTSTLGSFGRGVALIAGQNFVFYVVDSTRVRFLSTNGGMLSGDAVSQTSPPPASPSGSFAFFVGGSSANGGLTRVGRLTVSGTTLNNMLMDVNDASNEIQFNNLSNGGITAYDSTTGRGQLSFKDSNGTTYSFVFYLSSSSSGVIQDVSPSGTANLARVVADGSIEAQTAGPFSSTNITGTYALNWSGLVVAGGSFPTEDEEDLLAQTTVSSLALSGTSDIFQFTSSTLTPQTNLALGGSIKINGDGTGGDGNRSTMSVIYNRSSGATVDCVVYFVSPQLAFFANNKNTGTQRIIAGVLKAQQ
jgi:hypothetical protein